MSVLPGFKTHITVSTVCGMTYGVVGYDVGVPLEDCVLAGTLCSVGGILPDLDSDSGKPVKEIFGFLAAVVPMMAVDRLAGQYQVSQEHLVLIGIGAYVAVRFGLAKLFSSMTVHRGMWHSLPAAAIAGLGTFLLCQCKELDLRIFRAGSVVVGFVSHLLMDELWSIKFRQGIPHFKKSFGTALKLWSSKYTLSTLTTYAVLSGLIIVARDDSRIPIDADSIKTTLQTAHEKIRPGAVTPDGGVRPEVGAPEAR